MTMRVLATGGLTTVQDRGRTGWAHLGVPRAGALDGPAAALANRLVGNGVDAAVVEVTLGGLVVRLAAARWCAVTGAALTVLRDGRSMPHGQAFWVPAGSVLSLGVPEVGVRSYLALAGGIAVEPVLGSRSTDVLAGVGPPLVEPGMDLPLGPPGAGPRPLDVPGGARQSPPTATDTVRIWPGPRADWCEEPMARLCAGSYTVADASNRVGLRLVGPEVVRRRHQELASEGVVMGAVQIPPNGQPVVFLADHPATGGYPVAAVVHADDLALCAQLRPGAELRFTPAR
ncbi:biotin-dependent carboxyltransferase family protein [Nocardioides sp. Bht2]|uniref:5-oxoprolinase subunit C family protein n=1 Tax=Nocardioides sp. Bht2 TaxID=3392297 RepID=UPI0039B53633